MTQSRFDDISSIALPTDRELIPHLQVMIEEALRRQVWIMFLDAQSRPLPMVIPLDVDTEAREGDAGALIAALSCVLMDLENATLVIALERPGPMEIMDRDRRWLACLREVCVASGSTFRGPYLMLGDRIVQAPPDDYAGVQLLAPLRDEDEECGSF